MLLFLAGAIMLGFWAAGLFFYSFYRKTGDRLFLTFAFSFWLLSFERIVLAAFEGLNEHAAYAYLLRLIAYSLIIYAVIEKNSVRPKEVRNGS